MNTQFRLMPEQGSQLAGEVDRLYYFLLAISGVLTIAIAGCIVYFAIKYRRSSAADRTLGHTNYMLTELAWIGGPFALTMVIFIWGAGLHFAQTRPPADSMVISCVGRQWMWKFQHPNGRAEINDLHVPLGQPVRINMISEDVIHSLFLPVFRTKQDVLPGRYTTISFTANKIGQYHLFCAEYCGAKHSNMRGAIHVMEPASYQQWLEGMAEGETSKKPSRLFDQMRCTACHAGGGESSRAPPLINLFGSTVPLKNGQTVVADENYIRESILKPRAKIVAGYEPIMPSFEGQVSEEGILQLIAEIKAMGQPAPLKPGDTSQKQPPTAQPAPQKEGAGALKKD